MLRILKKNAKCYIYNFGNSNILINPEVVQRIIDN